MSVYRNWVLFTLCVLTGCAGLTARKVPVAARIGECDGKIHGFRYYLSRPYLVVSKQVSLGSEIKVGTLGYFTNDQPNKRTLFLACPTGTGDTQYFHTNGQFLEHNELVNRGEFMPLKKATGQASGSTPAVTPAATPPTPAPAPAPVNQPAPAPNSAHTTGTGQQHIAATHAVGEALVDLVSDEHTDINSTQLDSLDIAQLPPPTGGIGPTPIVPTPTVAAPIIALPNYGGATTLNQLSALAAGSLSDNTPQEPDSSMSIVMLPDFEEQMAIDDRNGAGYSLYSLRFKNGWQLTTVNGSWDATAVPVDILKVLGTAVGAAQDIKLAEMRAAATAEQSPQKEVGFNVNTNVIRAVLIRREFLAPGMYKLLKAEEKTADLDPNNQGYFSDLGITSSWETTVKLISSD